MSKARLEALCVASVMLTFGKVGAMPPVRQFFDDGVAALAAGHPTEARDLFLRASVMAPDWALAQLELGVSAYTLDANSSEARHALERATTLQPDNPRGFHYLGLSYAAAERWKDATSCLLHAVTLRADLKHAWFDLAEALQHSGGDPRDIATAYEHSLRVDGDNMAVWGRLAEVYESMHATDKAEAALVTLTRAHPTVAYNYYQLGSFYQRNNMPQKARSAFARAAELDPRPNRKMRQLK